MATQAVPAGHGWTWQLTHSRAYQWLAPLGRLLFAAIFLISGVNHFTMPMIDYAASEGVPLARLLVPLSGAIACLGAISIILGYKARYGAALIVLFLLPVTFAMHRFWAISDPAMAMVQRVMFLKNLSMLGGALLLMIHGAGPISIDARSELDEAARS